MIEDLIKTALVALPKETVNAIKGGVAKVNEFAPMIDTYHDSIPLEGTEKRVSYMVDIKGGRAKLYQVVLAMEKEDDKKRVFISRTLNEFDLMEKVNELTDGI